MALYSVRSERQFREPFDYGVLFRWFLDMDRAEGGFVPPVSTHKRTEASVKGSDEKQFWVIKGAPRIIQEIATNESRERSDGGEAGRQDFAASREIGD